MRRLMLSLMLPVLLLGAWSGYASDGGPLIPPASYGDQCVADIDIMREQHMTLLNHQRDETVIEGIRGEPYSLVSCVNCHAQRDAAGQAIRIDAPGQFCETCHTYAAVKIDCFTCHAALPEAPQVIGQYLHPSPPAGSQLVSTFSSQQLRIMQSHNVAGNGHEQHDNR